MKALVVVVSVCIVLGGFGGVVGQIEGVGQEGVDVVENGVAGEPDLQGFEAQGEVQGADQEHQGFVIGGGTGSLRFGLVNALLGGAPAQSRPELPPPTEPPAPAPAPAVFVGGGEDVVFTENPPTTPVQHTFVSAVPGQSQQVVLPISTETVVQVDGSCEFSGCQPETSSDPAFGLPSQEGNELSSTSGQVITVLVPDTQSLPLGEENQVSFTAGGNTSSSFMPETDGSPLGTAEESSFVSEEGNSIGQPSEVGNEASFASEEGISTDEVISTSPSPVLINGTSFTSAEGTSSDGVTSISAEDISTAPPSEAGSGAPITSEADISASPPSEVRDEVSLASDEGTSNSDAPFTAGEDSSTDPSLQMNSVAASTTEEGISSGEGPSISGEDTSTDPSSEMSSEVSLTSEEETSTGETPSISGEDTSTDQPSEMSSETSSTSEEEASSGEAPSTAQEDTSTDRPLEMSSETSSTAEEETSTGEVPSTPQEDVSTSSPSNVTSDVPFRPGQDNTTASSLGSLSSPPVAEASGLISNNSSAPSAEIKTPAGTLAPSVEENLPPPSTGTPSPTPATESPSPSPSTETAPPAPSTEEAHSAPSTETAPPAPSTEEANSAPSTEMAPPAPSTEGANQAPSTEEFQLTPTAESSQSPAGEEQSPAGEIDESKSPEEEAEGPESEEEAREISMAVLDAVQEANTTAVVERLETSDNVEALAEGFTFPAERRVEFLVKTEERVEDGDVVTMKAIAEASLSSKEYNKLAKVFVLSVFPKGNDTLVGEIEELIRDSELMEKIARADPTRDFLPSTGRRLRRRLTCDGCTPVDSFVCAHCWTSVVCSKFFWCPG